MAFRHEVYSSPYAGSIADIIGQQAEIRARAAQQTGLAQARAAEISGYGKANTIGAITQGAQQTIGNIGQIMQQKQEAPMRAAEQALAWRERLAKVRELDEKLMTSQANREEADAGKAAVQAAMADAGNDPAKAAALLQQGGWINLSKELLSQVPKPSLHNVPAGTTVIDGSNPAAGPVFTAPPTPPKAPEPPSTIDGALMDAYRKGDSAEVNRLLQLKRQSAAAGRDPSAGVSRVDPAKDNDRKRLVTAVLAQPNLWDDLTPSQKGEIAADLSEKGFVGFGKRMSEGAITTITGYKTAKSSLQDLRKVLGENEQYLGPIAGLQAINPYSDARKAQAKIDLVRQRVGKTLEGGVLRKEDEEKYKKILATLNDEPSTAIYKIDSLIETMDRDMETYIEEQRSAGRRVGQQTGPVNATTVVLPPPGAPKEGDTKPIDGYPGTEQTFRGGKWIRTK